MENNICYDDLNIADFPREYVAGDLYRLLLHDRTPIIELVTNNNLPKKRFVIDEAQRGENHEKYTKGKHKFIDQFKKQVEEEKKQNELHLRSKFLSEFTTFMGLKEQGRDYQAATGFEKIFAAQILLGEVDLIQPENFGVIEKAEEKLWAKIDHGKSLYICCSNTGVYLQRFIGYLSQ